MEVCVLKIQNFSEIDISKIKEYISKEKMIRVNKLVKNEDKIRGIYGELIIRKMIIDKIKINNSNINFGFNRYGKPYLKGREDIQFNVSHSGQYIVCCLDDKPSGIDVEKIIPIELKGIAESFLSLSEQNYIFGQNTLEESINRFYEIWTLRESFVKCVGRGLSISLNEFYIYFDKKGQIKVDIKEFDSNYFFKKILVDRQYIMSVCSQNNIIIEKINYITQDQLINNFNYKYNENEY